MSLLKENGLNHIPGDLGLPYFGKAFSFLRDAAGLITDLQKSYGNIFKSRFFGIDNVYLLGPEANKFLLVDQAKYTSSKEAWDKILKDLFPNGLMLMDGDRHKKHRSILNVAFKKEPMQGYLELIQPIVKEEVNSWPHNTSFPFYLISKKLALSIAGLAFFGLDFDSNLDTINRDIINVLKASLALPVNLPFTKYGKGLRSRKRLERYFKSLIDQKRAFPTSDLFSILCHIKNEEGESLTDQEVIDHLIFILMAGHDTAASTMTSAVYLLGKHPEWQREARKEAQLFLENNQDYQLKDLQSLQVIGNVIKETLRFYPPVTMVGRVAQQPISFGGFNFPAKTHFTVVFQHTHKSPTIWDDPELFRPDRFTKPHEEHRRCPHAYAPFGAGPHYCLGYGFAEMELKVTLLHMLYQWEWSFPDEYVVKMNQVPLQEPSDNLPINLRAINRS